MSCRTSDYADRVLDVLVYGATPGGIAAAIAAQRELGAGGVVELVEPLHRIGGMIAGGMVDDSNAGNTRAYDGVAAEFFRRVAANYSVTNPAAGCFQGEPGRAEGVFRQWLEEEGVRLTTGETIEFLAANETAVDAATLAPSGRQIAATLFVDATYEGDLLPLAGVPTLFGREGAARWGESLAGQGLCTDAVRNDAVFTATYETFSVPVNATEDGKLLAGVDGMYDRWNQTEASLVSDTRIQSYNFRACLTKTQGASHATPITAPSGYNASRFELFARYIAALEKYRPHKAVTLGDFLGCGSYGHGKCDTNDGAALGLNPMGNETYHWALASPAERQRLRAAFVNYTLGLFHFLGYDTRVPAVVRAEMQSYKLCADEWAEPGEQNLPHIPYVREGRRMDGGDFVFTQEDYRQRIGDDKLPAGLSGISPSASALNFSIGLGCWFIDCHATRRTSVNNLIQNEGCVQYGRRLMDQNLVWEIPFGVSVPPQGSVQNVLSVCAPSASHVGFQPLRIEPTWMTIGQAVGVAAALASKNQLQPRQLGASTLQAALRGHGMILSASEMKPADVERSCGPGASPSPPEPAAQQPVSAVPCNASDSGATRAIYTPARGLGLRWALSTSSDGKSASFEAEAEPPATLASVQAPRDPAPRYCLSVGEPLQPEPTSQHGVRLTLARCSGGDVARLRPQQWVASPELANAAQWVASPELVNATLRSALQLAPRCFGSYAGDNCTLLTALAWEPTQSKTVMLWMRTADAARHPQRWTFSNGILIAQGAGLCLAHNLSET